MAIVEADPNDQALIPAASSPEVVVIEQQLHALAQANTIEEVKSIRDKAEVVRMYAKSAILGLEVQNYAAELKLRSERKAGTLLLELQLRGSQRKLPSVERLSLDKLGINRNQSSRWQQEAKVPNTTFEQYLVSAKKASQEISAQGLLRLARQTNGRSRKRRRKTATTNKEVKYARVVAKARDGIRELQNHRGLLAGMLVPFCSEQDEELPVAERRLTVRVLTEMADMLTTIDESLQEIVAVPH